MNIRVLLVLGMVITTPGSIVEKNDTIEDTSNTTENIFHDGNVTMGEKMFNVRDVTSSENIESNLKNSSNRIVKKSSFSDDISNNLIGTDVSTPSKNVDSSKVDDKLRHNSNETVKMISINNDSSNVSNNIEISMPSKNINSSKIDDKIRYNSDENVGRILLNNISLNNSNDIENFTPMNNFNNSKFEKESKNIILVLSEGADDENSWETLRKNYSFAAEGFFQSCEMHEKSEESSKIASSDDVNCNCHKQLNYVIKDLMDYARTIKGMNAAIVSKSNITTSTDLGLDNLAHHHHHYHHKSKLIGEVDNVSISAPIDRHHSRLSNNSHWLHIDDQLAFLISSSPTKIKSSTPTMTHSPIQHYSSLTRDRLWDFLNMITKVRWDFLKDIFDSMHKSPVFNRVREINSRRKLEHFPAQRSSTIIELVTNTLIYLQNKSNENGFLMIIVASHNELSKIYKVVDKQHTAKDNLIIFSGLQATDDKKLIPYLAKGASSNSFNNIQNICKLLSTIKLVLGDCQGICKDENFAPPSMSIPLESFIPKIRVARSDDEDTPMEDEKLPEKEDIEFGSVQEDVDNNDYHNFNNRSKSSGISFYCKNDSLALLISIVSSIFVVYILHK